MSRCNSREQAEAKIVNHLTGSPFHLWSREDAVLEAQGADIPEWDDESDDPAQGAEPELWTPRAPVEDDSRPNKRRRQDHSMPPNIRLTAAPKSSASGVMAVPSAAVGGNAQVASFLQNQIRTACAMTKAGLFA